MLFSVLFPEKLRIRENSRISGAGNSSGLETKCLYKKKGTLNMILENISNVVIIFSGETISFDLDIVLVW